MIRFDSVRLIHSCIHLLTSPDNAWTGRQIESQYFSFLSLFSFLFVLHCIVGVGYGKIKYLKKQYGPGTIHMMELIKKAIDPNNIMNPGKVVN